MAFLRKLSMDLRRAALCGRQVMPVLGAVWGAEMPAAAAESMEEEGGGMTT